MAFWKPSRPKDVEPAVASAPAPVATSKPKVAPPAALKRTLKLLDEASDGSAEPQNKGFDPYNSGAFNFKDTWSKVNRKK